ncbi:Outer membrane protein OmpA [Roseateles sp. YR242]|uniref:OmpA family protein n=1 Tax=Roseateles sp. YR242 TaxID=1855305 RepID=UPI0008AD48B0|nr:OmpA family protein [Roseateles sp. YR242]SEK26156.1 Outer membrane protein OmpA [Roseateles sp. YR242]
MQTTSSVPVSAARQHPIDGLSLSLAPLVALTLLTTGCASMNERHHGPAQGASVSSTAGNLWSRQMDEKRAALERATAGTGIEVVRTDDNQLRLNVPADVSFDAGRADVKPTMRPVLDEVSRHLDANVRLTIVGHTDGIGPAAINDPLSLDRAEAVREYLVNHGVQRGRLLVEGRGAREPLASNATEAGRATNRRVEIFLSQPAS